MLFPITSDHNISLINEIMGLSRKALRCIARGLTFVAQRSILYLLRNINIEELDEYEPIAGFIQKRRLYHSHAYTPQGAKICVCSVEGWGESQAKILCSSNQGGANDGRTSTRKTSLAQNKIKAANYWRRLKNLVANHLPDDYDPEGEWLRNVLPSCL